MNDIFKGMLTHGLIERNPLATVFHVQHDRDEGEALTPEAEEKLFEWLYSSECICKTEIALLIFCGLRPNEMENQEHPPVLEGKFVKAVNSKRHFKDKRKIEYKYIPICNRAKPFFENGITVRWSAKSVRRRLKEVLPNNTLKDLRTTFYTRCQMFGVSEVALKEFVGHSFGKLGNAYSDLTKFSDYLLKEGEKLNKQIDLFLQVVFPHPTGVGSGCPISTMLGPIAFFPYRREFAWKLLLCVGRTLLNISPKELYPTWEFALWAVSLLDQESEIPQ